MLRYNGKHDVTVAHAVVSAKSWVHCKLLDTPLQVPAKLGTDPYADLTRLVKLLSSSAFESVAFASSNMCCLQAAYWQRGSTASHMGRSGM